MATIQLNVSTIGDQVKVARTARRWTQSVLATVAKVNQGVVSRLERNLTVNTKDRANVLKALNIDDGMG